MNGKPNKLEANMCITLHSFLSLRSTNHPKSKDSKVEILPCFMHN